MLFPGTARILRAHLSWDRTHTACASRGGSNSDYYEPITVSPIGSAYFAGNNLAASRQELSGLLAMDARTRDLIVAAIDPPMSCFVQPQAVDDKVLELMDSRLVVKH